MSSRATLPAVFALLPLLACEALVEEMATLEEERAFGIYIPVAVPEEAGMLGAFSSHEAPLPIFLNRNGGTYTAGNDNSALNISSVVQQGSATVSAFAGSGTMWNNVVSCVTQQFSRFHVYVTDVEPTSGAYIEAVIGGRPQQLGLPSGVGGVAPIDPYQCRVIRRAVVYVFTEALPSSSRVICETAAQEIAHAMSLDHQLLCKDPMTYLTGCGEKSFQDVASQCGEFSPRECICNRPSQNSVQLLYQKVGAASGEAPPPPPDDQGPPTISVSSPADGASLPADSTIQVVANASDDLGLVAVELVWDHTGSTLACPGSGGGWTCARSGTTYTWSLNVGTGTRTFRARARDVAGNVTTTESRTIVLGGGGSGPADDVAPEVSIVRPEQDAVLLANSIIEVVATATDDREVQRVELSWEHTGDVFGCPLSRQNVTCEQTGSTYTWRLNVGTGTRAFRVRALDAAGNATATPRRSISLSESPPPAFPDDEHEPNDTFDTATPMPCASGLDLVAAPANDDWLKVAVAEGIEVTAALTTEGGVRLHAELRAGQSSAEILDATSGTGSLRVRGISPYSTVALRVRAEEGAAGSYRVVVTCRAPSPEDPLGQGDEGRDPPPLLPPPPVVEAGCAQTGSAPWLSLLAALALLTARAEIEGTLARARERTTSSPSRRIHPAWRLARSGPQITSTEVAGSGPPSCQPGSGRDHDLSLPRALQA